MDEKSICDEPKYSQHHLTQISNFHTVAEPVCGSSQTSVKPRWMGLVWYALLFSVF